MINTKEKNLDAIMKYQAISSKEVLNVEEASIFTGYKKSYLYKLSSEGSDLPVYSKCKGAKLFFKKSELEQWVTGYKKTKVSDVEEQIKEYLLND